MKSGKFDQAEKRERLLSFKQEGSFLTWERARKTVQENGVIKAHICLKLYYWPNENAIWCYCRKWCHITLQDFWGAISWRLMEALGLWLFWPNPRVIFRN